MNWILINFYKMAELITDVSLSFGRFQFDSKRNTPKPVQN